MWRFFKKVDTRKIPVSGPERAKKMLLKGRGVSLKGLAGRTKLYLAHLIHYGDLS